MESGISEACMYGNYFARGNMDTGHFYNLSNLPWTVATKWTCEALVKCFSIGNMEQRGGGGGDGW